MFDCIWLGHIILILTVKISQKIRQNRNFMHAYLKTMISRFAFTYVFKSVATLLIGKIKTNC